jgi:uncharacterized membrane protein
MSLKLASVLAATITAGVMAGVFGLYAHTIMRGLGNADDRTFVAAFQSIDRAIINPLFMLAFLGALVFSGVAVVLYLRDDGGKQVPWLIAAFALYLAVVVITVAIHLPLNDDIKAAGDPDRLTDLAAVRENFPRDPLGRVEHRSRHRHHRGLRLPRVGARARRTLDRRRHGRERPPSRGRAPCGRLATARDTRSRDAGLRRRGPPDMIEVEHPTARTAPLAALLVCRPTERSHDDIQPTRGKADPGARGYRQDRPPGGRAVEGPGHPDPRRLALRATAVRLERPGDLGARAA